LLAHEREEKQLDGQLCLELTGIRIERLDKGRDVAGCKGGMVLDSGMTSAPRRLCAGS
jgi:hypothetical protein